MDIDLSNRETYTNTSYPYTIEYPAEWSVDDADPSEVDFTSPGTPGIVSVLVREDVSPSVTLDQTATTLMRGYQQGASEEGASAETLNQQDVTLPNDHPGRLFDFRLSSSGVSVRQKAVVTLVSETLYAATVVIPEAAYTSSVDQQADDILTSLTISDGATGTTSA